MLRMDIYFWLVRVAINKSVPFLLIAVLAGCGGYQVKYGEVRTSGSILYPLCERAKQRITDMQRISFELPLLFKQAPCRNYPDYSYTSRIDSLSVTIPGVIANESKIGKGDRFISI